MSRRTRRRGARHWNANNRNHKHDTVYCYVAAAAGPFHEVDGREVSEARWFHLSALPVERAPSVDQVIALLQRATPSR